MGTLMGSYYNVQMLRGTIYMGERVLVLASEKSGLKCQLLHLLLAVKEYWLRRELTSPLTSSCPTRRKMPHSVHLLSSH